MLRCRESLSSNLKKATLMGTQISPMLAVSDGNAAIEFYKAAFGVTVLGTSRRRPHRRRCLVRSITAPLERANHPHIRVRRNEPQRVLVRRVANHQRVSVHPQQYRRNGTGGVGA